MILGPADANVYKLAHDLPLMNELVAVSLDMFGEAGIKLLDAGEEVAQSLIRKGIMIRVFWR